MGVRKFRSIEEMNAGCDLWYTPGDPRLWSAIRRVWELGSRTPGYRYPPGVYKFRTLEEANRLVDAWERDNFQAYRRRLGMR